MDVCGIITMVKGNPKLKTLGKDLKRELEKGPSMLCGCMLLVLNCV